MVVRSIEVRIANIQWWTIFGAVLLSTGLILIFLSYSTLYILPSVPNQSSSSFLALGGQTLVVGIIASALGLVIMLYSKFRLSSLSLNESANRTR